MKLTCDEATAICDKNQYSSATFWEKIKLSLHVFLCKKCGMYSKQNVIMTKCYEKKIELDNECPTPCLKEEEKVHMDKELMEKI